MEIISGMTSEWTVNIIHLPAKYKQDAALQTGRVEEVERIYLFTFGQHASRVAALVIPAMEIIIKFRK